MIDLKSSAIRGAAGSSTLEIEMKTLSIPER